MALDGDSSRPIAHVRKNPDGSWAEPHWLVTHLRGTAELAARFAASFGSGDWGYASGISHDTGKSPKTWQKYIKFSSGYDEEAYLEGKPGRPEHSGPGAAFAEEIFGKGAGRMLAYCIAGHHAGLPDWEGAQSSLDYRLKHADIEGIPDFCGRDMLDRRPGPPPWKFESKGLDMSLWIRMLFSCLVDADFLDTESYMDTGTHDLRGEYSSPKELLERFNAFMDAMTEEKRKDAESAVNIARRRVLADCRAASRLQPGVFSLTVPTGGGKTLSSMAFALEHAVAHGKSRIIYVLPYTSIIEQNADVFRKAVGEGQVVEHHSSLDPDDSTPKSRLASENWDAPVIVTTSVQFFESLFAARASRCRKLHNIANSVVILDEAQLVPVGYLDPILAAMRLLHVHYGVTFVICTATQPALECRPEYPDFPGLPAGTVHEIIRDVPSLYRDLRRVDVSLPSDMMTPQSWEEVATELSRFERVLCIVSDRKSCRELHRLMPEGCYHLSALMCAQHRSEVIESIKGDLIARRPVRVISTQLVEAGVDIDFPVVYRALAGLDSIAQAAGRCNREGKLNDSGELGRVKVFIPPRKAPVGILRKASETATGMIEAGLVDPISHDAFEPYFAELYWKANSLDSKGIVKLLSPEAPECGIQFRSAAEAFEFIDDRMQRTILVPYGNGGGLIRSLKSGGPERGLLRKLQRYSINVYVNQFEALLDRGSIEEVVPKVFALICPIEYDPVLGLLIDEMPDDPAAFMVSS